MNWQQTQLKYVTRFAYGDSLPSKDEERKGTIKVFGSNGPFEFFSKANTQSPVIVIGRKGSYGKVNWSDEPVFASDTTFFVDSTTTKHHLRWLFYALQTLKLDEGSNETAVPGLNRENAYQNTIMVPSLEEQRAIADYLDRAIVTLGALIAAKTRLLDLLAEKRRALITQAVTRGLHPDMPLKDSGVDWQQTQLKYVARFAYGDALPSKDEERKGTVKVFGSNGPFEFFSKANTQSPVIVIGRKGSYGKVNWSDEPVFASDTTFFVDSTTTKHHLRWLFYVLQTLKLDEGSNETAVPGLNRDNAYQNIILVPSLEEQRAIAAYLLEKTTKIDNLTITAQKTIELLRERRTALIAAAVTGQVRI